MTKITPLFLYLFLWTQTTAMAFHHVDEDTTIVSFSDKSINKKVTVISTGTREIELPISLNLDELLKKFGVDSLEREKAIIIAGQNTEDTLLILSMSGDRIQIVSKSNKATLDRTVLEPNSEPNKEDHETKIRDLNYFSKRDFGLYLGLNALSKDSDVKSPFQQYQLRDWKSRYITFSFRKNTTLIHGNKNDLAISYGPELAIYHFRLENSNIIINKNRQTTFEEASFETRKSQLTIPYLNFPVLVNLGLKESKYRIAVGAYAGYRLGANSKTKSNDGNKEKIKNNYNLSNFIYGLTGEIGKKNSVSLFFRYDLNKLFDSDQIHTKHLQAFSFGLRL
jgi:hypothetical protein